MVRDQNLEPWDSGFFLLVVSFMLSFVQEHTPNLKPNHNPPLGGTSPGQWRLGPLQPSALPAQDVHDGAPCANLALFHLQAEPVGDNSLQRRL